ncbi:ribosome maturation factor RimM [Gordonia sp. TBRC 11910]|uniref:Ribosome maturation factor RimM n=1 Tax=Gordonia asplenii TaxID=2725283 RepID=A0A848KNC1_9ACTN|nr:ribosome maturation factor RimM [Gordonia asplenii]NMN99721.1 ribosome maturation factor RimM [Gordonia asplenii]
MDLVVGRVVKSHGIRGELVVDVRTDDPDVRFAPGVTLRGRAPRGGGENIYTVAAARSHSGRLLLSLTQVTDRTTADAMRGVLFLIDAADVSSGDDPDEFYDHELEGVQVVTVDGDPVGVVEEILHLGASDLLSVRSADGRELLIPFVAEIVPECSTEQIVIDPPDGLLTPEQW